MQGEQNLAHHVVSTHTRVVSPSLVFGLYTMQHLLLLLEKKAALMSARIATAGGPGCQIQTRLSQGTLSSHQ